MSSLKHQLFFSFSFSFSLLHLLRLLHLLHPLLLLLILLASSTNCQKPMVTPGDGRVVKAKLESPFSYSTILPGVYNRVISGMHNVSIVGGRCSNRLFDCFVEQDGPNRSVARLKGIMNYGLHEVTFLSDSAIPITVLFYCDHYWPTLGIDKVQWLLSLPLVNNAKGKQIVTFYVYIAVDILIPKQLDLYMTPREIYEDVLNNRPNFDNSSHILNFVIERAFAYRRIALTVKRNQDVDYYCLAYNKQYYTYTIVWDSDAIIPMDNVKKDLLSIIPIRDILVQILGSADRHSLHHWLLIIVASACTFLM